MVAPSNTLPPPASARQTHHRRRNNQKTHAALAVPASAKHSLRWDSGHSTALDLMQQLSVSARESSATCNRPSTRVPCRPRARTQPHTCRRREQNDRRGSDRYVPAYLQHVRKSSIICTNLVERNSAQTVPPAERQQRREKLAKVAITAFAEVGRRSREKKKQEKIENIRKRFEQHLGVQEGSFGGTETEGGDTDYATSRGNRTHRHSICVGAGVSRDDSFSQKQNNQKAEAADSSSEYNTLLLKQMGFEGENKKLFLTDCEKQTNVSKPPVSTQMSWEYESGNGSEDEENIPMLLNEVDRKDVAKLAKTKITQTRRPDQTRRRKKRKPQLKSYMKKAMEQAEQHKNAQHRLQAWGVVSTNNKAVMEIAMGAKGEADAKARLQKSRISMQARTNRRDSCADGSLLTAVATMAGGSHQDPMRPRPRSMSVIS